MHKATGYRIERVAWSSIYRPAVRMVDRYRVGRVFLGGGCGACSSAGGRPRTQYRRAGCLQLGLEARTRPPRRTRYRCSTPTKPSACPIAAAVLGLSKRLHQTRSIKRGRCNESARLALPNEPPVLGHAIRKPCILATACPMPGSMMAAGSSIICAGSHATELVTPDGTRILIRPDGYIAHIGSTAFVEYAGEPTRKVCSTMDPGR